LLFANIKEENTKTYSYEIQYQSNTAGSSMIQLQDSNAPVFKRQHLLKQVLENLLVIMATVVQQIHKNSFRGSAGKY
jgi:hypothetical protein